MARRPNYDFEKRKKEQARKQKQEEKRARRIEEQGKADAGDEGVSTPEVPEQLDDRSE